jgi:hypothetical protein
MIARVQYGLMVLLVLAAGFSLGPVRQVAAQIAPAKVSPEAPDAAAPGDADAQDADTKDADTKDADAKDTDAQDADPKDADAKATDSKDVDISGLELDWSLLNVDASTLNINPSSKARSIPPQAAPSTEITWSSQDKPNGSAAVSVKQPLSTFWDARVGADMTVAPQPLTASQLLSEKLANGGSEPQSSGTAWAAITAPGVGSIWDKTAVEARVDPSQDQSKVGTSLSKSLPLSEQYSLSLQNDYNVIQQGVVPVPGIPGRPLRNYETDQSAKLSIAETGTSFIAGQSLSSTDDRWLRKIGAEQKLFGGVSISGSIGETPLGVTNKSLTAGFKQSW